MQKIRTALEECQAVLKKSQRIGSIERTPHETTVNFEPGHVEELALIKDALNELSALEVRLADSLRMPHCAACDEASPSRLEGMKPPAIGEADPTGE